MKITLVEVFRVIAIIAFALAVIFRSKIPWITAIWVALALGIIFLIVFIIVKVDKSKQKRVLRK